MADCIHCSFSAGGWPVREDSVQLTDDRPQFIRVDHTLPASRIPPLAGPRLLTTDYRLHLPIFAAIPNLKITANGGTENAADLFR